MTTIMPEGEAIRKAIKWISAELEEKPDQSKRDLINKASLTYNLSPVETEFLIHFYRKSPDQDSSV